MATPLARRSRSSQAGWGGLSSSDSSLSDSPEGPGEDGGWKGGGDWPRDWDFGGLGPSDQRVLGPEQAPSLGEGLPEGQHSPQGLAPGRAEDKEQSPRMRQLAAPARAWAPDPTPS